MRKQPSLVVFTCQGCDRQIKTDARMGKRLLPWRRRLPIEPDGTCPSCRGDLWTMQVAYVEVSSDHTAASVGLFAVTGIAVYQTSTSSNESSYPNVPAKVLAQLNSDPRARMQHIAELASIYERDRLVQKGGVNCQACNILFVPVDHKAWNTHGYCSKACMAEIEGPAITETLELPSEPPVERNSLTVTCEQGHQFTVQISFRGMVRPCATCGAKTRVPD